MKKRYFSALALCLALNTTSAYASTKDDFDSEKSGTLKRLPIDALAADKPEEAVKIAKTQHDLSELLKKEIASAIKAHYPFLAQQVATLRTLGVDPAKKCNPLLVEAYCDGNFLANDLKTASVSGFSYTDFCYKPTLETFLKEALDGVAIKSNRIKQEIPSNSFHITMYQLIENHIKKNLKNLL